MQNSEVKRDDFQKYLESAGVIDKLTKVLVGLYEVPERPSNPVDFIKEYLGESQSEDASQLRLQTQTLEIQLRERDEEIAKLNKQIETLKTQLQEERQINQPE